MQRDFAVLDEEVLLLLMTMMMKMSWKDCKHQQKRTWVTLVYSLIYLDRIAPLKPRKP